MENGQWFRGPGRKGISPAILRNGSPFGRGGGFGYGPEEIFFSPPLRLAESPSGQLRKSISRRDLRRNLPSLPGPCQAFLKKSSRPMRKEAEIPADCAKEEPCNSIARFSEKKLFGFFLPCQDLLQGLRMEEEDLPVGRPDNLGFGEAAHHSDRGFHGGARHVRHILTGEG
jgi:hypothetical protein